MKDDHIMHIKEYQQWYVEIKCFSNAYCLEDTQTDVLDIKLKLLS